MFSGIIKHTGTIASIKKNKNGAAVIFQTPVALNKYIKVGSSLSCDGVCLTITKKILKGGKLFVTTFLMNETLRLTTFSRSHQGDIVNLEPSLRIGDEVGGHFVFGHVDGIGRILELKKDGGSVIATVEVPQRLLKYFVKKGSVSLNGISLTIIKAGKNFIKISLIPHTIKTTNLKYKKTGALLNVEVDMLTRYANLK